jgi:hypothetical protein
MTLFFKPYVEIFAALALIAGATEKLEIRQLVRASVRYGCDVVNCQFALFFASVAERLRFEKRFDIGGFEFFEKGSFSGSSVVGRRSRVSSCALWMAGAPISLMQFNFFGVGFFVKSPKLFVFSVVLSQVFSMLFLVALTPVLHLSAFSIGMIFAITYSSTALLLGAFFFVRYLVMASAFGVSFRISISTFRRGHVAASKAVASACASFRDVIVPAFFSCKVVRQPRGFGFFSGDDIHEPLRLSIGHIA